jgi:hypothetical protein
MVRLPESFNYHRDRAVFHKHEHSGPDGGPIQISAEAKIDAVIGALAPEELDALVRQALTGAPASPPAALAPGGGTQEAAAVHKVSVPRLSGHSPLGEAGRGPGGGSVGDFKRLIISMPPRHGKSLTASVYFPAWYLGLHPERAEVPDGLPAARKRLYVEGPTAQAAIDGLMAALHKTVGRAAFPIAVRVHQERYVCVLCPSDTYFSDREEARAHAKQHAVGPVRWVELVGVGRP